MSQVVPWGTEEDTLKGTWAKATGLSRFWGEREKIESLLFTNEDRKVHLAYKKYHICGIFYLVYFVE